MVDGGMRQCQQVDLLEDVDMQPGIETFLAVRALFIQKGTSLSAFCTANGIAYGTAAKALKGGVGRRIWHGDVQPDCGGG